MHTTRFPISHERKMASACETRFKLVRRSGRISMDFLRNRRHFAAAVFVITLVYAPFAMAHKTSYAYLKAEVDHLRSALLAYCKRDTLAMVEVHRALTRLALH
jgi:hypothetical protein